MKKKRKQLTIEELFPNARARLAADEAIDKLAVTEPMNAYLDQWEAIYFSVAKHSPFRGKD
jgi:hypothetical protein